MKKTKHFNISVPELGDVPDITQVSNAISDLEDATAGTLEIMKAEMQGTKITLTSVSRKTKRTGYYEGMSIRFKSPQDIEPNYLKTVSVDGLGDQTLSVEYKVNRNEYIDIVYEGNKFTAYPVVVQKTDSVSNNSSVLVGTAKGVKTAYDKGVEALNKANQAQSSANKAQSTADGKVSKSGDTMTGPLRIDSHHNQNIYLLSNGIAKGELVAFNDSVSLYNGKTGKVVKLYDSGYAKIEAENLGTQSKEVVAAINELNSKKEDKIEKKSGFNLEKSDSVTSDSSSTLATSAAVKSAYDKGVNAERIANTKEPAFIKNTAFNKNFGTSSGTVLEGDKYPLIEQKFKGVAGDEINPSFIQSSGEKKQGKFYLDKNTGRLYRCIKSTTSTTNSSENFEDVSLANISDRLNNMFKVLYQSTIEKNGIKEYEIPSQYQNRYLIVNVYTYQEGAYRGIQTHVVPPINNDNEYGHVTNIIGKSQYNFLIRNNNKLFGYSKNTVEVFYITTIIAI